MQRDSLSLDSLALEELRWLSSCITVGDRQSTSPPFKTKTASVPCPVLVQHDLPIIAKRKRESSVERPRPRYTRRVCSDSRTPRVSIKDLYDLTDSESEKRDVVTPLRFVRALENPNLVKVDLMAQAPPACAPGDVREGVNDLDFFAREDRALSESFRLNVRRRPTSPLSIGVPVLEPAAEVIQTSSSLPTRSPPSARRQTGYFDFGPESLPSAPSSPLRNRSRKARSVGSQSTQQSIPPLWTSILRPKSKSQRSVPSLKAKPSQSLSIKDAPPVSFFKSSPISRNSRDDSESTSSSASSCPSTPPLTPPRFPRADEDVFGRSSPTWLPDIDTPMVVCRSRSSSSAMKTPPRRKDSSASSATHSSASTDGSLTPTGSNKSVKFADRPVFHYPSTLYWDRDLKNLTPADMGLDLDSMDLEEIAEIGSGAERLPLPPRIGNDSSSLLSCADSGVGLDSGMATNVSRSFDTPRCSSPVASMTSSTKGSLTGGFHFFTGKAKRPAVKEISGPFNLSAGSATHRGRSSERRNGSRSSTPVINRSSSRPGTPTSRPATPVSQSRSVTPVSAAPGRRRRLVKPRSKKPRPHMYPLSRSAPLSNIIGSTESFRSIRSIDARSFKSVPEDEKTRNAAGRGRQWWWSRKLSSDTPRTGNHY